MGSILCHGQGKGGGDSADFFDGADKFMDVQPINPPANSVPALFSSRRREGLVLVSPSPTVVFSFPSNLKVLYGSFAFPANCRVLSFRPRTFQFMGRMVTRRTNVGFFHHMLRVGPPMAILAGG